MLSEIDSAVQGGSAENETERQLLSRAGQFPTPNYLEFDIHEAANDYFQSGPSVLARYLPFWLANLVKKLLVIAIPLLTLLLPLMKIAPVSQAGQSRSNTGLAPSSNGRFGRLVTTILSPSIRTSNCPSISAARSLRNRVSGRGPWRVMGSFSPAASQMARAPRLPPPWVM